MEPHPVQVSEDLCFMIPQELVFYQSHARIIITNFEKGVEVEIMCNKIYRKKRLLLSEEIREYFLGKITFKLMDDMHII